MCAECADASGYGFLCDEHRDTRDCPEELLLPVVNSPRVGVCWYTGEDGPPDVVK